MNGMTRVTDQSQPGLADALAGLALVLAAVSAGVGLFVSGLYRDTEAWIRQANAADLVTLFAVVPVLAIALWRARAGSTRGRLIALAGLGYLIYNYAIFGFAVAINPMTPAHYAVLGLSVWSLILMLVDLARYPVASGIAARLPRRTTATFLISVAVLFALMWMSQIAHSISTGATPSEVASLGLTTNPVFTLDLAFALPFLAVAGLGIFRDHRLAAETALVALAWVALMGLGVLAIFALDALAGAAVPWAVVIVIGLITVVGVALTAVGLMATPRRSLHEARKATHARWHKEATT